MAPCEPHVTVTKAADRFFMEGMIRGRHEFRVDERTKAPPVGSGQDWYPSPVDYLIAALVSCQVAVLTQCLAKARLDDFSIDATAAIDDRSDDAIPGEMPGHTGSRIEHVGIELTLKVPANDRAQAERCLEVYDAGCIVGQSLRGGIEYTPSVTLETHDPSMTD